jgi:hypothetical protein
MNRKIKNQVIIFNNRQVFVHLQTEHALGNFSDQKVENETGCRVMGAVKKTRLGHVVGSILKKRSNSVLRNSVL